MSGVSISRIHFPVTTLGPGRRLGIWFQGCSIRCAGCISADTWKSGLYATDTESLLANIREWSLEADGLTVSGGEPFEQPEALEVILRAWRRMSTSDVLVFTGYEFHEIEPWVRRCPGLIDAVMVGPFVSGAPQTKALRGSDNQSLHALTELGRKFVQYERRSVAEDRRLDVMFDSDGSAWFAGIPAQHDFARLQQALASAGHRISVSSDAAEKHD